MSMSDEIALDEDPEAGQFEIDTFAAPGGMDSDDDEDDEAAKRRKLNATNNQNSQPQASGSSNTNTSRGNNADVVFEIGDEDDEDSRDEIEKNQKGVSDPPPGYEDQSQGGETSNLRRDKREQGNEAERKGLIDGDDGDSDDEEENGDGNESKETLVPKRELDKGGKKD